jgi:type IV pilus assembly protein PilV
MNCSFHISRRRTARRNQTGVALIEVMVSLLIFSVGVLGMVAMQGKSISYAVSAEDRSRAALLTNEIVAAMWLEGTATPSTMDAWKARVKNPVAAGLPNAVPSVSGPDTDGVITVSIQWQAHSKTSSETSATTHTSADTSTYFTQVVIP